MTDHDLHQPPSAADQAYSLSQVLRRAACQLAAIRAASAGMLFGPTLDDRVAMLERAREELVQLEQVETVYTELTGRSLVEDAEALLGQLPQPACWRDASLTRLLVCLSARVALEQQAADDCDVPALACEIEHVNAAHAALRELGDIARGDIDMASPLAARWLDVALQALDDEAARARYLSALEREFGLRLPN